MNKKAIEKKIEEYLKRANAKPIDLKSVERPPYNKDDGLSRVIRSKEEAEAFMAQLDLIGYPRSYKPKTSKTKSSS